MAQRRAQQSLKVAAETGDINGLYGSIKVDPRVLDRIDAISFVDTPLHTAASAGHADFAIEILRLMPSFGRKLNPDGLSSLHLALINEKFETAKRLIEFDKELIRVKGREGITPLHVLVNDDIYGDQQLMDGHNNADEQQGVTDEQQRVADIEQQRVANRVNILAEFLFACPNSIEDLTIRDETALHIAVKSKNQKAVKVILGCICRIDRKSVLDYEDKEGKTALAMAESPSEIVRTLRSAGASSGQFTQIVSSLWSLGALESSSPDPSLAEFLNSPEEPLEVLFKIIFRLKRAESMELLNIGLLAVLIATVLFKLKWSMELRNWRIVLINMVEVAFTLHFMSWMVFFQSSPKRLFNVDDSESDEFDLFRNGSYINATVSTPDGSEHTLWVARDDPLRHLFKFKYAEIVRYIFFLFYDFLLACSIVTIMLFLPLILPAGCYDGGLLVLRSLLVPTMSIIVPVYGYSWIFMVASSCCGLLVYFGSFAPFIIEAYYKGFAENSLFSNLQRERLLMLEHLMKNALG